MKTKKKLLITVLLAAFVVISVVSIIAIVFAATQQTVKTTLNISYTAEDIDAKVSATMTYQDGYSENLGSITFTAGNTTAETGNLSPSNNVELSTSNQYVIFQYTFENTGDKDFVAMFDYTDTEEADKNMEFGYNGEAESYKENANAVLVLGGETKTYSVKVNVDNLSRDAHLSGDMSWDMTSNIVVATPSTAQSILDSNINGKTVVFSEGEYTEVLHIRPSRETSIYPDTLLDDPVYMYQRTLENVKFMGTNGALFSNYFAVITGQFKRSLGLGDYDPIRGKYYTDRTDDSAIYDFALNLNNITFFGLDFFGAKGRIHINNSAKKGQNLLVSNCRFITDEVESSSFGYGQTSRCAAVYVESVDNVTAKLNYASGHFQGVSLWNLVDANASFNKISNTIHNAICTNGVYIGGSIVINNNTISNATDRALRFGPSRPGTHIEVSNNTFADCTYEGSLLRSQTAMETSTYSFTNNMYNGSKLNDASGTITTTTQWDYFVNN